MYKTYNIKIKNTVIYSLKYQIDIVNNIIIINVIFKTYDYKENEIGNLKDSLNSFIKKILKKNKEKKNLKMYIIKYYSSKNKKLVINYAYITDYGNSFSTYALSNIKFNLIYIGNFVNDYFQEKIKNNIKIIDYCIYYIKYFCNKYKIETKDILFNGISRGGFLSIYSSLFFNDSICIAFNPVVHKFEKIKFLNTFITKNRISVVPENNLFTELDKNKYKSNIFIFVSDSVKSDNNNYYYDMFSVGTISKYRNIYVTITKCDTHLFFLCYKYYKFINFLNNYYINMTKLSPNNFLDEIIKYYKN
jgi:hypothetical protein